MTPLSLEAAIAGFASVSFLIAISPGPSWIYVITARVAEGARAGRFAILGNATGIGLHCLAVTAGVATLLSVSARAFSVVQFMGAGYLVYLGIRVLLRDPLPNRSELDTKGAAGRTLANVYSGAVMMALLNPSISLFMLALLPQFVNPSLGSVSLQSMALGLTHVLIASTVLSGVAATAGSLTGWLERSPRGRFVFRTLNGTLLIAFGVGLAVARLGAW